MLSFTIDQQKCTGCKRCVSDCPAHVIAMGEAYPYTGLGVLLEVIQIEHVK